MDDTKEQLLDAVAQSVERTGDQYMEAAGYAGQLSDIFWYVGMALREVARNIRADKETASREA